MELNIKNFAKIKDANLVVNGITVIAGENNTGKSTVGKILFSLFNAMSNLDEKIFEERLKEIENTNRTIVQNYINTLDIPRSMISRIVLNITKMINIQLQKAAEENLTVQNQIIVSILDDVIESWRKTMPNLEDDQWSDIFNELYRNISEIMALPEEIIVLEIISRYFNEVFYSQINTLSDKNNQEAVLNLKIREKEENLTFTNNYCKSFTDEVKIAHKAIYIDNPFVIDELSKYNNLSPMDDLLKHLLTSKSQDSILDGVIETVRAKEKLGDIYAALQNVVDGEIILNQNDEFFLKPENISEPISFHNLSTGIKSFVILKMLLEKGCLKDKDVVILDEPEIHLHPQWQIAYAELIVLLQKQFDLSVVVTTHSPYFVDAINLFSCKYDTDSKVNYYLSSNDGNQVRMDCVTDKIELIYKKMASPIQMLDTLRHELNN